MTEDEFEAALTAHQRELIEPASTLYASQRVTGDEVREQSKAAYRRLLDAHLLITGVLAKGMLRIQGKIVPTTNAKEERNALFASYVIGMEVCERAIEEGRYLQACALLRQEMETLAQVKAVSAGTRKENRAPNVAALEKSIARLNGDISAATHLSKHHIVRAATAHEGPTENLPGPTSYTRYFPAFDEQLARRLFGMHLLLTLHLIEEWSSDMYSQYGDGVLTKSDVEALDLAMQLMIAEGILEAGGSVGVA